MADKGKLTTAPRLRFPQFRHAPEWGEATVGSRSNSFSGGTPETTNKSFYGGMIPFIRSAEVGKERTELSLTKQGLENSAAKLVDPGDVLVALYGANSGDVALAKVAGAINQAILCVRPEGSKAFLYHFLTERKSWILATYLQGGQGNLSGDIVKSIALRFPSLDEQEAVADCLTSLDDCVAAQWRKLEALQAHKRALTQQLFPRKGETFPRLRFPEFHGPGKWAETILSNVCEMRAGKFIAGSDIAEERVADLFPCYGGNGLRGYTKSFTHVGKYSLIGRQGALCGNVKLFDGKFHATEHALVVTPKDDVETDWLFYALDFLELNRYAIGQAQPGLSVEVLETVSIVIPLDPAEQRRIADCLSSLDTQIAAETEKLDALKSHKKGLMQQLFPSPKSMEA